MANDKIDSDTPRRKVLARNILKFVTFGLKMYENGLCDKPIENDFKLVDSRETYGYTKKEASDLLGLSVRQFDRKIRKGEIRNGRKIRGITALYWDKDYIDKLSARKDL